MNSLDCFSHFGLRKKFESHSLKSASASILSCASHLTRELLPQNGVQVKQSARLLVAVATIGLVTGCSSLSPISGGEPEHSVSNSEATQTLPAGKVLESAKNTTDTSSVAANASEETPVHNSIASKELNAAQMAAILQAELMARRGQFEPAYDLYIQVAKATSDSKVLKRAFELSMVTYDADKIREATDLWKTLEPTADAAWRASFLLNLRSGDVQKALEEWQVYQDVSPLSLDQDLLVSAQRVAASVPVEQGLSFFQLIVAEYPNNWVAHFGFALIAGSHQLPDLAIEALKKSAGLAEKNDKPKVYQALANLYVEASATAEGIPDLKAYLEAFPEDYKIQERLARLQVLAEDFSAAIERYQLILENVPEDDKARLSLALLQMELKDYQSAIDYLQPLLAKKAYQAVAYYYQGMSLQELKRYDEALESFAKVGTQNYFVDALLHRAEIFFSLDKIDETFAELDKIPTDRPENLVKQLRAKAIFMTYDEKYDQAIDYYDQVLEVEPGNTQVLLAQSYLYYNQKRFDAYEVVLQKVIELKPDSVEALNGLGYFYVEQGVKLDQAKELLQAALAVEANNYFVLDSMGWLYFKLQDYPQAIEYLSKAFAIAEDEEVFAHLVQAYIQNAELEKAKQLWNRYYSKFKNETSIVELKSVLPAEFFN